MGVTTGARRLGIFGGTFDPPHNAHLALARSALQELQLDAVHWIAAAQPWQKARKITEAGHREAMLHAAIDGEPRFVLDRIELERAGPSYTLDTVKSLRAADTDAQWFLIIGADQYAGLHTWRGWQQLLGLVTLAVANRPGLMPPVNMEVLRTPHQVVPLPMLDISSTDIRERVARGQAIDALVPPAVARYIYSHALYRNQDESAPQLASLAAPRGVASPVSDGRAAVMDIRKLQRAIVDGLEDVKAQDIRVFNTEHLSPLFERVIVASGTSNRQTKALAASVRDSVKSRDMQVMRTEGEDNGEWIIVDCGAAVVHVMQPAIRQYYNLEELWGEKSVKMKFGAGPALLPKASPEHKATTRKAVVHQSPSRQSAAAKKPAARKAPGKKAPAKKTAAKKATPRRRP